MFTSCLAVSRRPTEGPSAAAQQRQDEDRQQRRVRVSERSAASGAAGGAAQHDLRPGHCQQDRRLPGERRRTGAADGRQDRAAEGAVVMCASDEAGTDGEAE